MSALRRERRAATYAARAVVMGTAVIRPDGADRAADQFLGDQFVVSTSPTGVVPAAKSSISGRDAPAYARTMVL
jgi:hypothetical protein